MQYKQKVNDYITSGVRRGYVVFNLKCSFCLKHFYFEFIHYRSSKISCSHCKKKAYQLIYHNKSNITLRRYFSTGNKKKFEDVKFGKKNIDNYVKGQHEFPQMYLKNFCIKNSKKIWVYNKKEATIKDRNIETFSKRLFLYDQAKPQTIENMLWSIEDEMGPYLLKIISSNNIFKSKESIKEKQDKKNLVLRFIISMYLRRKIIKKLIFEKYKDLESKEGNKINIFGLEFDGVYSRRDKHGRKIINELIQETHRNIIRISISQEKMYKDYTIHLLINRTTTPFITSDNPIIKQGGIKFREITIPSRIFLPISPNHYLLLAHPKEKCKSSEIEIKEKEVNNMNHWQYTNSNKYLISNRENIEEIITLFDITENNYIEIPLCAFDFISQTSNMKYRFLI